MAGMLNKVMGILGLDDGNEEEYENDEIEEVEEEELEEPILNSRRNSKVVNIHTSSSVKVVIAKPKDFEEATSICEDFKARKIIVINVSDLEQKTAQRLLDFMGGASFVLGGTLQEVEKSVYMLSPSNVEVSSELRNEISGKGLFWAK